MLIKHTSLTSVAATLVLTSFGVAPAAAGPNAYLGEIIPTVAQYCPRGTAEANGQLLAIADNPSLFSVLGTSFGGDGKTNFALPNLQGRVPVGAGTGAGLSPVVLGQAFGAETHTLTINEMPAHNHAATSTASSTLHASSAIGDQASPDGGRIAEVADGNVFAADGDLDAIMADGSVETLVATDVDETGEGKPFSIVQPSLVIRYCVATIGVFPSRD